MVVLKMTATKNMTANRLIHESSPYLLQHAYNPVDWYPWGDEAFELAKREDKPVFLSVGYSSCHWCHVMERESFSDEEVAELLNKNFISVKLDREERPDADHLYMEACVAMTDRGGWPLSCFLSYDRRPFYAGSYFPRDSFINLLNRVKLLWNNDRDRLTQIGSALTLQLEPAERSHIEKAEQQLLHKCYAQLESGFDAIHGGFGLPPKFPMAHTCMFLLRYALLYQQPHAAYMARFTLEQMARGGIFDHVGGGFCRYSTDRYFLVPHFEKMIYDNAMLTVAYVEAGLHETARSVLSWCLDEMQAGNGGFYTALDADSEGAEGKFYCYHPEETIEILGHKDGMLFNVLFDITNHGNFEGLSIPNLLHCPVPPQHSSFAVSALSRMREARRKRPAPRRDNKQLTGNNGLMLAALSTAARILGDKTYLQAAIETAQFILRDCFDGDRLTAGYTGGRLQQRATSDDYAYAAWGFYRLHQATLDGKWLNEAKRIADDMLALFAAGDGCLYLSGYDVKDLPARLQNTRDGALPCGNSVAAGVFLRLYQLTGGEQYQTAYSGIVNALAGDAARYPMAHTALLSALALDLSKPVRITFEGRKIQQLVDAASEFHPFITLDKSGNETDDNRAVLCSDQTCQAPLTSPSELKRVLARR
jgi:hypothetical protein